MDYVKKVFRLTRTSNYIQKTKSPMSWANSVALLLWMITPGNSWQVSTSDLDD